MVALAVHAPEVRAGDGRIRSHALRALPAVVGGGVVRLGPALSACVLLAAAGDRVAKSPAALALRELRLVAPLANGDRPAKHEERRLDQASAEGPVRVKDGERNRRAAARDLLGLLREAGFLHDTNLRVSKEWVQPKGCVQGLFGEDLVVRVVDKDVVDGELRPLGVWFNSDVAAV
jgi:hypothetical protein